MLRAQHSEHLAPVEPRSTRVSGVRPRGVAAALQAVVGVSPALHRARTAVPAMMMAVVHTRDRVRFSAVASRREELIDRLAGYVRDRAPDELWPDDAACVRDSLAAGDLDAAITHYFATVGRRWDEEWLVTAAV